MMKYVYREYYSPHLLQVPCDTFPGYEDPLQRQPQENQTSLIFLMILVWMNCNEVDYMLFTLFVPISKVNVEFNISSDSS